jgi:hypothetical protein
VTKSQLTGAEAQMGNLQGGSGGQSELVATNERELRVLEQLGDRDYFPFRLHKGKKQVVATVVLELRRVNARRKTYTMTIFSGERTIEKKNGTLDEAVQFYAGEPQARYELVVNKMGRSEVRGYVAAPKPAVQAAK